MERTTLMKQPPVPVLAGVEVRRLMRVHHRTIRTLARAMNVTMKRVREVREKGVSGDLSVWEWRAWIVEGQLKF